MALYVLGSFEWHRREVVFSLRHLPYDYEELCPSFDLVMAEEYAQDYEAPELPQVVFMVMLLNDAVKLAVLRGWMIVVMESALKELRWNAFQAWTGRNRGRIMEARRQEASSDSDKEESSGSDGQSLLLSDNGRLKRWLTTYGKPSNGIGAVSHALRVHSRKTIRIYVRTLFYPRRRRLHATLNCPKIVQATFYAMLRNDAVGLGIVNGFIAADLKPSFEGLRWTSFESWMYVNRREEQLHQQSPQGVLGGLTYCALTLNDLLWVFTSSLEPARWSDLREPGPCVTSGLAGCHLGNTKQANEYVQDTFRWHLRQSSALRLNLLPEDCHGLYSGFDVSVVTQYAHDSSIPEIVQAMFYAMVLNDTAELGLSCRIDMNCTMSVLRRLNWAIIET
ncbi:hypothetical protein Cgig2_001157 [Carnegiea gigantea]|uniref:Uncharacterized protein n=1 Tax=Carnegiea gigantea TaxID=171969 RepID=A0A9Q1K3J0_9CARY|nr:hypothetical protein Cgig2_001157 [Carnegiea gigantea]